MYRFTTHRNFNHTIISILLFVLLLHTINLAVIAEDAFISFRFARNLINGHGLVWNVGGQPVEGYTNFLWVVLMAIVTGLRLDVLLASQILGFVFSALTIVFAYRFSVDFLRLERTHAFFVPLFLVIAGPIATWAGSGMETSLFAFFVMAACYYWVRFSAETNQRDLHVALAYCLLASLTRPEGVGVTGTLLLVYMWEFWRNSNRDYANSRLVGSFVLVYAIPFLIYFILRYSYFGYLLPNTFYAKTGSGMVLWFRGIEYLGYFVLTFLLPFAPMLRLVRSTRPQNKHSASPELFTHPAKVPFALTVCWAVTATYILYIIWTGGDYMAMYRFIVPILPLIYVLISAEWYRLTLRLPHLKPRFRSYLYGSLAIAILGTLLQSTPLERAIFPKAWFMHGTWGGVQIERWHSNRLTVLGQFFKEYGGEQNLSLATRAIGATSFYSELPVYGVHGLVDPDIAHSEVELGTGFPGHEKENWLITLEKSPDIFMFSRALTRTPLSAPEHDDYRVERIFERDYELVSIWLEDPLNNEEGYFTFLQKTSRDR